MADYTIELRGAALRSPDAVNQALAEASNGKQTQFVARVDGENHAVTFEKFISFSPIVVVRDVENNNLLEINRNNIIGAGEYVKVLKAAAAPPPASSETITPYPNVKAADFTNIFNQPRTPQFLPEKNLTVGQQIDAGIAGIMNYPKPGSSQNATAAAQNYIAKVAGPGAPAALAYVINTLGQAAQRGSDELRAASESVINASRGTPTEPLAALYGYALRTGAVIAAAGAFPQTAREVLLGRSTAGTAADAAIKSFMKEPVENLAAGFVLGDLGAAGKAGKAGAVKQVGKADVVLREVTPETARGTITATFRELGVDRPGTFRITKSLVDQLSRIKFKDDTIAENARKAIIERATRPAVVRLDGVINVKQVGDVTVAELVNIQREGGRAAVSRVLSVGRKTGEDSGKFISGSTSLIARESALGRAAVDAASVLGDIRFRPGTVAESLRAAAVNAVKNSREVVLPDSLIARLRGVSFEPGSLADGARLALVKIADIAKQAERGAQLNRGYAREAASLPRGVRAAQNINVGTSDLLFEDLKPELAAGQRFARGENVPPVERIGSVRTVGYRAARAGDAGIAIEDSFADIKILSDELDGEIAAAVGDITDGMVSLGDMFDSELELLPKEPAGLLPATAGAALGLEDVAMEIFAGDEGLRFASPGQLAIEAAGQATTAQLSEAAQKNIQDEEFDFGTLELLDDRPAQYSEVAQQQDVNQDVDIDTLFFSETSTGTRQDVDIDTLLDSATATDTRNYEDIDALLEEPGPRGPAGRAPDIVPDPGIDIILRGTPGDEQSSAGRGRGKKKRQADIFDYEPSLAGVLLDIEEPRVPDADRIFTGIGIRGVASRRSGRKKR